MVGMVKRIVGFLVRGIMQSVHSLASLPRNYNIYFWYIWFTINLSNLEFSNFNRKCITKKALAPILFPRTLLRLLALLRIWGVFKKWNRGKFSLFVIKKIKIRKRELLDISPKRLDFSNYNVLTCRKWPDRQKFNDSTLWQHLKAAQKILSIP